MTISCRLWSDRGRNNNVQLLSVDEHAHHRRRHTHYVDRRKSEFLHVLILTCMHVHIEMGRGSGNEITVIESSITCNDTTKSMYSTGCTHICTDSTTQSIGGRSPFLIDVILIHTHACS